MLVVIRRAFLFIVALLPVASQGEPDQTSTDWQSSYIDSEDLSPLARRLSAFFRMRNETKIHIDDAYNYYLQAKYDPQMASDEEFELLINDLIERNKITLDQQFLSSGGDSGIIPSIGK